MNKRILLLFPFFLLVCSCATLQTRQGNIDLRKSNEEKSVLLADIEAQNNVLIKNQKDLDQKLARQNLSLDELNNELSILIAQKQSLLKKQQETVQYKKSLKSEIRTQEQEIKMLKLKQEQIKQLSGQEAITVANKKKRKQALMEELRELNGLMLEPKYAE
ncbi:MAG: hypothetical protein MI799_15470 [Desulfobacterales bacterium]|nr:hypothetical protein [Desulfobacterales bacterium]